MNLSHIKILVIGDIMLDHYVVGETTRISPEAPVPIVNVTHEYHTLGGCGNVVRNLAELGVNVTCIASVGIDINAEKIHDELEKIGARDLLIPASKTTTVKERVIADHRKIQMLRIDRECVKPIGSEKVIEEFKTYCKNDYDMIIVSDYAKGMITYGLMDFLKNEQDAEIIVDPKPSNASMYDGVFMITPNDKEWAKMMVASDYNLKNVKFILHTKGKDGMTLIDNQKEDTWNIDAEPVPVYNVSGAGDVVVAMMAVCLSNDLNVLDSTYIANKCAGYAVTQPQTCVIPKDKFEQIYKDYFQGKV